MPSIRNLDFATLRMLVAVCEHQNIARAAVQEHIVPSAISKRIAQLEGTLGTPLFERGRRGVRPTPAGLALLEHARTILFTASRIESDVAACAGGIKGHVRLLATPSAIAGSLLDDVAAFTRDPVNRHVKVEIEEMFTRDVERSLRDGNGTVGVCWRNVSLEGLCYLPYRPDALALAVHPEHPLAGHESLRFDQTLDHDHVSLFPSSFVAFTLQRAAVEAGRTLKFRAIVSNFDAALRIVAANLAISVIPAHIGSSYSPLLAVKVIPLTDAWAKRAFAVCHREDGDLQPPARRLVEHLVGRSAP